MSIFTRSNKLYQGKLIDELKKIPCVGSKYKLLLNGIIILESVAF